VLQRVPLTRALLRPRHAAFSFRSTLPLTAASSPDFVDNAPQRYINVKRRQRRLRNLRVARAVWTTRRTRGGEARNVQIAGRVGEIFTRSCNRTITRANGCVLASPRTPQGKKHRFVTRERVSKSATALVFANTPGIRNETPDSEESWSKERETRKPRPIETSRDRRERNKNQHWSAWRVILQRNVEPSAFRITAFVIQLAQLDHTE